MDLLGAGLALLRLKIIFGSIINDRLYMIRTKSDPCEFHFSSRQLGFITQFGFEVFGPDIRILVRFSRLISVT